MVRWGDLPELGGEANVPTPFEPPDSPHRGRLCLAPGGGGYRTGVSLWPVVSTGVFASPSPWRSHIPACVSGVGLSSRPSLRTPSAG